MSKNKNNPSLTNHNTISKPFIFTRKNYLFMALGFLVILLGFLLMMGDNANTRPDGVFDPNYFNNAIFSFRRIRLAPLVIMIGFGIEIFAIIKSFVKNN